MRSSHNNSVLLIQCLREAGIQPSAFAFFLIRFSKSKPQKRFSPLALLLFKQLQSQAELIEYHLRPRS
jgi:hypothetical protein